MSKKFQQKNKEKTFPYILFVSTVLIIFGGGYLYQTKTIEFLHENGQYTIGILKNIRPVGRSYSADCIYFYKGKKFNCRARSDNISEMDENKPALILFYPKRPSIKRRFTNYHIPDTITYIPQEGWKELPGYIYPK